MAFSNWLSLVVYGFMAGVTLLLSMPVAVAADNPAIQPVPKAAPYWDDYWSSGSSGYRYGFPDPGSSEDKSGESPKDFPQHYWIPPQRYWEDVDPENLVEQEGHHYTPYAVVLLQRDCEYRGWKLPKGYYQVKLGQLGDGSPKTQLHPDDENGLSGPAELDEDTLDTTVRRKPIRKKQASASSASSKTPGWVRFTPAYPFYAGYNAYKKAKTVQQQAMVDEEADWEDEEEAMPQSPETAVEQSQQTARGKEEPDSGSGPRSWPWRQQPQEPIAPDKVLRSTADTQPAPEPMPMTPLKALKPKAAPVEVFVFQQLGKVIAVSPVTQRQVAPGGKTSKLKQVLKQTSPASLPPATVEIDTISNRAFVRVRQRGMIYTTELNLS